MGILLDIVLLALLGYCTFRGIKNGAVRTIFSMLSFVIALILTILFASPFAQFVERTPLGQSLHETLQTSVNTQIETALKSTEEGFIHTTEGILDELNIPEYVKQPIMNKSDYFVRNSGAVAADAVSEALASAYLSLLSSVVLFILFLILLRIVRIFAEKLFTLPFLREANTIVGAVAGFVNGVFSCYLVLGAVNALSCMPSFTFLLPLCETSLIYKNIFETNMMLSLFV